MPFRSLLRFLLSGAALAAIPMAALASITLATSPSYQQTTNSPCVIGDASCNEPSGFTYNEQSGTPTTNGGTYDLYSKQYTATSPFTTYNGNLIETSFSIGIDDNVAAGQGSEDLVFFNTLDCTSGTCVVDSANSYTPGSPTPISVVNGNGFSDVVLNGFSLTAGHIYEFEASVSNDTDGMEEFFIVPAGPSSVPEPASILLFGTVLVATSRLLTRRRA